MKKRMIAAKPFRYGTRMLQAGDVFDARAHEARALVALKRADMYAEREHAVVPPPPADLPEPDMDELRERARSLGLRVDRRWSDETLARKIAEAAS